MIMSLGRMLATGKSLVGGQNSTGRYHLSKQMGLPKFVSPRNPFAAEVKTAAAPLPPVAPDRPVPAAPAVRSGTEQSTRRVALVPRLARALRRSGEWLGKANPFSRFAKPAGPKKSAVPCFTKPPVQSELCLDNVQVVRNDLSDADLEVVPVVPVAPAGVDPDLAAAGHGETAGKAWGRLTARIFGSTHT
jgi:hypothetical protein